MLGGDEITPLNLIRSAATAIMVIVSIPMIIAPGIFLIDKAAIIRNPKAASSVSIFEKSPRANNVASLVTAQLLFRESENPKKEISFYINSPGGLVTAGLGIYDTMQYIKPDVSTLCIGQAASMGSFLLAAGEKGKRFSLPNSRIMVHQPSAGFQGQATDIEIHANEVLSLKKRLNQIYSKHTGKSEDEIKIALERDNFMTSENAKEFGLIDQVVEKRS